MNDKTLYNRYMRHDSMTHEELVELAKWLVDRRDTATLLGDGNLAEWYGNVLNGVLTAIVGEG